MLTEYKLHDKPGQIFNADETGFNSKDGHNSEKVVGVRGYTTVQNEVLQKLLRLFVTKIILVHRKQSSKVN